MPKMLSLFMLLPLLFMCPINAEDLSHISIYDLQCEYLKEPLGVDVVNPCLTWKLKNKSKKRGLFQSAYQIIVSSSLEKLNQDIGDLWDTGMVKGNPFQIIYQGTPLKPTMRAWWKVRIWDNQNRVSSFSEPSFWEMGLISNENWTGNWIEPPEDLYPRNLTDKDRFAFNPALLFRKTFSVDKNIERARLYITGLGYYECFINGKRVGDHELDPGWTNFSKRVFYSVYDISDLISNENNVIGAHVGSGWYNPLPLKMWGKYNLRDALTVGIPKLRAQIEIDYKDGTKTVIGTDETWKVNLSPIVKNNVYLGEEYDGSKDPKGWNENTLFDDSNWKNVVVPNETNLGKMQAQPIPPIKIGQKYYPDSRKKIGENKWLVDFGQNLAGRIHLIVKGATGQKIQVRYGELLYPDGTLNPMTSVCGQIKGHEIPEISDKPFTAEQKDIFTLKGDGEEELFTHFTYHGFRYAEIEGLTELPAKKNLWAERLHTAVEQCGNFETSKTVLDNIQKMCVETLLSNLHSVQTDCPHREKFGYGGDIVATSEFAIFNFDMAAFYRKTVRDFADEMRPNGGFTETAPFVGIADSGFGEGCGPIAWGTVHPFLLWNLYLYYGDKAIVEEQYQNAKKWVELLRKNAKEGIITQCIGDHESIAEKQVEVTATAYYYLNAILMEKLSFTLNFEDDWRYYKDLSEEIKKKFNEKFFDSATGKIGIGSQANQVIYYAFNLADSGYTNLTREVLINDIKSRGNKLTTGIFGTKYLLGTLCNINESELAYKIVMQKEFPGWRHMLENGATTLWEHWEFSDNTFSHNHPMFGSVSEWFYKYLGGIRPAEYPYQYDVVYGFDKIIIMPNFRLPITKVNCTYNSARGKIISSWQKNGDEINLKVELPPNCKGIVLIPDSPSHVFVNDKELKKIPLIFHLNVVNISNGRYTFKIIY